MAAAIDNVKELNGELARMLGTVREINRAPIRRGETRVDSNLDEELKRKKLVSNEPV